MGWSYAITAVGMQQMLHSNGKVVHSSAKDCKESGEMVQPSGEATQVRLEQETSVTGISPWTLADKDSQS